MKRNVDLTDNMIFSRNNNNPLFAFLIKEMYEHTKYPWRYSSFDEDETENDLRHQKKSLIALGNKKKRAEIRMYREMDNPNYCDCCGRVMNKKPWDNEVGICHKCQELYDKEPDRDKCPWRFKGIDIIQNAIIRTV